MSNKIENARNIFLVLFTVIIPVLFQLTYVKYVSYYVSKVDYGNYIVLSTFVVALVQVFLSMPLKAFNRFYNGSNKLEFINEFRTYTIFISIICIFLFYIFYLFYGSRFNTSVYIFMYFIFVLSSNYIINQKIYLLNVNRKIYFFIKVFEGAAKFIFPIVGYLYYGNLEGFTGGIVAGYFISSVMVFFFLKEYPFRLKLNFTNQKKYFIYAYPVIFSSISSWSITFSDRYFIDYFLNTEELAKYAILIQFAGFSQVISMVYTMYATPIILREYETNRRYGLVLLKKYLYLYLYLLVCLFMIFLTLPRELFGFFIEKDIINSDRYYLVFVLIVGAVFLAVFQTASSMYFVLLKKLKIHAIFFLIAAVLNFILNFYIEKFGLIAAGFSTLISYIVLNFLIGIWIYLNKGKFN